MKSLFSSRDKVFFLCLLLCPQGFQPSASPKSAVFLIWIYVLLAVAFYYKTGTQNLFFGRCAFYNNISVAFFFAAMIACSAPMKKNSIVLKITTFSNRLLLLPLQTSRTWHKIGFSQLFPSDVVMKSTFLSFLLPPLPLLFSAHPTMLLPCCYWRHILFFAALFLLFLLCIVLFLFSFFPFSFRFLTFWHFPWRCYPLHIYLINRISFFPLPLVVISHTVTWKSCCFQHICQSSPLLFSAHLYLFWISFAELLWSAHLFGFSHFGTSTLCFGSPHCYLQPIFIKIIVIRSTFADFFFIVILCLL